ncbi:MAG TPA: hypothetical protein DCE78_13075 [Bacteroidetes bacterium]|nr:hypothetical protein [Bacteroidota bacterium]
MKDNEIDFTIKTCEAHLKAVNNPEKALIELYLTRYLLVFIVNKFENRINQIILKHVQCNQGGHKINHYFDKKTKNEYKGKTTSKLCAYLEVFGEEYSKAFDKKTHLKGNELSVSHYNSIIANRHGTAHATQSKLKFDDVVRYYKEAHKVLDLLDASLR